MERYHRMCPEVLHRHLRRAETLARSIYNKDHSRGGGEDHEDPPDWAQAFYNLFQAVNKIELPGHRSANIRLERNRVAASLVGRQAPLGTLGGWRYKKKLKQQEMIVH